MSHRMKALNSDVSTATEKWFSILQLHADVAGIKGWRY